MGDWQTHRQHIPYLLWVTGRHIDNSTFNLQNTFYIENTFHTC
jgi:hypothetical protein